MHSFMSPGKRIRSFRLKRGMTQRALGIAVGFPVKTADIRIAQYESGARTPKHDLLCILAQTLGFRYRHWKSRISRAVMSLSSCCKRWRTNTD